MSECVLPRRADGSFDLRRWMFDHGMSVRELSAESGVARATISNLQDGAWPSSRVAFQIAAVVGVPASQLWDPYGPADVEPAA